MDGFQYKLNESIIISVDFYRVEESGNAVKNIVLATSLRGIISPKDQLSTFLWYVTYVFIYIRIHLYLYSLSEVAGSKLTMNNPAITDLSDRYRPMKLSEMFNEMYDDDWTDAVEELSSQGIEEKTVVILLRNMVMVSPLYVLCLILPIMSIFSRSIPILR